MIYYCIRLHFTVSISLELRYCHFTSPCWHCEHDSDNRGSKYIVQCYDQRRTLLNSPVVQTMTRSDRVESNLTRHLPVRIEAYVREHTISMEDSTDLGGNQPKVRREYVPRRGGISSLCHWRIICNLRCQSLWVRGTTLGTMAG